MIVFLILYIIVCSLWAVFSLRLLEALYGIEGAHLDFSSRVIHLVKNFLLAPIGMFTQCCSIFESLQEYKEQIIHNYEEEDYP